LYAELSPADQARAAAFVDAVLFKPWRAGAQGPDAYDCWGLARAAQRELAGRDLPVVNADPSDLRAVVRLVTSHPLHSEWHKVTRPRHLDLVLMSHSRHPHHIGVWLDLDGGVVLHATEQFTKGTADPNKPGVMAETMPALQAQGWARFQFMRHGGRA
jgi:hypothetical protein